MNTAVALDPDQAFDDRMRLWGYWYGERGARVSQDALEEAASGAGLYRSPGAAAAAMPREDDAIAAAIRQITTMDRGANPRLQLMGRAAGLTRRDGTDGALPGWAADPIRGTESRSLKAKMAGGSYVPREAEAVELAVAALQRQHAAQGWAIRLHYCTFGDTKEKADRMDIGKGKFRELVAEGRGWVRCRLAA
jgi:hypothetical protein